jgi:predicted RNA-binding Zn ribbon-like protein
MPEPLSVEFANTRFAHRGELREGLGSVDDLLRWLRAHDLPVDERTAPAQVAAAVALRDAVRAVFTAVLAGTAPDPAPLNHAAAAAPRWPTLTTRLDLVEHSTATGLDAAFAAVATDAIRLLAGTGRAELRACPAAGCVLFFVRDHPRREWCSAACGNRTRAARHYERRRTR